MSAIGDNDEVGPEVAVLRELEGLGRATAAAPAPFRCAPSQASSMCPTPPSSSSGSNRSPVGRRIALAYARRSSL